MSNKVLVNNSTRISLNDRFTIMQSVGVPAGPATVAASGSPIMRHPRSRSRSRSRSVGRMAQPAPRSPMMTSPRVQAILPSPRSRLARHYEDVLDRRQNLARAGQQLRGVSEFIDCRMLIAVAMTYFCSRFFHTESNGPPWNQQQTTPGIGHEPRARNYGRPPRCAPSVDAFQGTASCRRRDVRATSITTDNCVSYITDQPPD